MFFFACIILELSATVISNFRGQFGNQLFQAAAAVSVALDNGCDVNFPDVLNFENPNWGQSWDLRQTYAYILHRIPNQVSDRRSPSRIYRQPPAGSKYEPIPYQPNIEINGFFESEKYFFNHREFIKELYSCPQEIEANLRRDFGWIIDHPKSVAIHVRTGYRDYLLDGPNGKNPDFYSPHRYLRPDANFYERAMELFDEDSLFIVFSDHIGWCKQNLSGIKKNIIFLEGLDHIHDFYLLSFCKDSIIANSTFGWWASYLNKNPNKRVVCRAPFRIIDPVDDTDEILCPDWIRIPGIPNKQIPFPQF